MGVIDDLIAAAKAEVQVPQTIDVKVAAGGKIVQLEFAKLLGADWLGLTVTHPPREGATLDSNLGFNIDATAADYPADQVTIAGETPSKEQWAEFYGVLDAPHRQNIATALWSINQFTPARALTTLGKASRASSGKKRS